MPQLLLIQKTQGDDMKSRMIAVLIAVFLLPVFATAGDYVIGEGDGLDISVWGVKDLNVSVKVRPDGKITMPGLGDVTATGVTSKELQAILGEKLKTLVKNPIVTVSVREITNSKAYIFGGGIKPGVLDLTRRTTLLQLLCTIGEVKNADLKKAYVLRNGVKIKEDFYKLFINGDTADDIAIETNDAIFIPLLAEKNVYVLGAVNTPKFIEYRDGMTAMEAILDAGGFTKFAKQNDTAILRKDGKIEIIIPFKAKDLMNDGNLGQNVKLKAGDYIIAKEGMF
jgi:polysaccharide export outer membrane protein